MFFYCCLWARDHRVLLKGRNYRERKFYDRTIFKKVHGNLLTQNILIYINCKSLFSRKKERFLGSRKQKKYIYIHIYLIKLNNFCFFFTFTLVVASLSYRCCTPLNMLLILWVLCYLVSFIFSFFVAVLKLQVCLSCLSMRHLLVDTRH